MALLLVDLLLLRLPGAAPATAVSIDPSAAPELQKFEKFWQASNQGC
jgi:hypothetical protein